MDFHSKKKTKPKKKKNGTKFCTTHKGVVMRLWLPHDGSSNKYYCPKCDEEKRKEGDRMSKYRTIEFNNRIIRVEGKKATYENLQPTVMHSLYCKKCKNRFTFACNECSIPRRTSRPSLYTEIDREQMRGPNDTILRVNAQWEKVYVQPMVDYDPYCKICEDRYTKSCNKCLWKGDEGKSVKHSLWKKCETDEKKGIIIEEIKVDVQPPFEVKENFSFFKMIKDGETIFMGMAHKDNIDMLREKLETSGEKEGDDSGVDIDDDMFHIRKDRTNIVMTKRLSFVNMSKLTKEERDEMVDKLFHMISKALSEKTAQKETKDEDGEYFECEKCGTVYDVEKQLDNDFTCNKCNELKPRFDTSELEFIKFEGSEICIMCGEPNPNDDINLCEGCLSWYEHWFPSGHPRE